MTQLFIPADRRASDGQQRSGKHPPIPNLWLRMRKYWILYLLMIPVIVYYAIFRYYPLVLQTVLSFKNYMLLKGVWGSEWVGFGNFRDAVTHPDFNHILVNTISISLLRIVFGFWPPLILAILLFDLTSSKLRRISQTLVYIPHFFSWVIVYGMVYALFANSGLLNGIAVAMGGSVQNFLLSSDWFRPILIGSAIWKEIGWGTIIYLAALMTIDPSLYEAAKIDGAGPLTRIFRITLPAISNIIVFLFTLSLGGILSAGGEQILLFYNPATYNVGDVIDTWIYRQGFNDLQYSLSTAVSFFQSMAGLLLVLAAHNVSKRITGIGIW
ncbi:ABC transporter permease [Paenibacillus nasutitermitis]|uniref:Protein LplB n=1 Tax=Paenibacillus nasutitermitis TaxID=1652958 RepID=A0A916YJX0_9BACL|nr:ABC transporter permease subunit [Paenibacillus nasutitermitis]GGD48493.1 protein LplB [Paenibacillus nasutitermitis]